MRTFMDDRIFIENDTGYVLYQGVRDLPIYDFHCHLSPREILEDARPAELGELWLKGDHYKWSLTLTAVNVTNKLALYNFLSTFSGTHYVTPRALTAQLGFHF